MFGKKFQYNEMIRRQYRRFIRGIGCLILLSTSQITLATPTSHMASPSDVATTIQQPAGCTMMAVKPQTLDPLLPGLVFLAILYVVLQQPRKK